MTRKLREDVTRRAQHVKEMLHGLPDCVDPVKRWLVLPGEMIDLASYGQRLQASLENDDEDDARHLLLAVF